MVRHILEGGKYLGAAGTSRYFIVKQSKTLVRNTEKARYRKKASHRGLDSPSLVAWPNFPHLLTDYQIMHIDRMLAICEH
ncbi:MAG: hypothetical protein QOH96_2413 [Blastocatellia bacterium]|nr:hypothetical protein [Blastocatellia bacterium]